MESSHQQLLGSELFCFLQLEGSGKGARHGVDVILPTVRSNLTYSGDDKHSALSTAVLLILHMSLFCPSLNCGHVNSTSERSTVTVHDKYINNYEESFCIPVYLIHLLELFFLTKSENIRSCK